MSPWIQTYLGGRFYPLSPRVEDVHLEDIAHALSNECRFGGHCKFFYSVAQHSYHVSCHCAEQDAMWGLLHDASEAYLKDIPRPVKHSPEFAIYREIETRVQAVVCAAFGLAASEPVSVKLADDRMLVAESRDLMKQDREWVSTAEPFLFPVNGWSPHYAELMFLKRYRELTNATG